MQRISNLLTEFQELSSFECQIRFLGKQTFCQIFLLNITLSIDCRESIRMFWLPRVCWFQSPESHRVVNFPVTNSTIFPYKRKHSFLIIWLDYHRVWFTKVKTPAKVMMMMIVKVEVIIIIIIILRKKLFNNQSCYVDLLGHLKSNNRCPICASSNSVKAGFFKGYFVLNVVLPIWAIHSLHGLARQ